MLLYHCIRSRTHHNLHVLPSFYSPSDSSLHVYGPAAGYESGLSTPPLSLHHARARHRPLDPSRAHLVASLCGEPCFLQRFLLRDNWVIVNGYAIVEYPDGVVAVDTREAARLATKPQPPSSSRGGAADADDQPPSRAQTDLEVDPRIDVDDSDRHPRDRVVLAWSGKRRVWRLVDARLDESTGEVWQAYVRRRRGNDIGGAPWTDDELSVPPEDHVHAVDDPPGDVDSVILLVWEPSS